MIKINDPEAFDGGEIDKVPESKSEAIQELLGRIEAYKRYAEKIQEIIEATKKQIEKWGLFAQNHPKDENIDDAHKHLNHLKTDLKYYELELRDAEEYIKSGEEWLKENK